VSTAASSSVLDRWTVELMLFKMKVYEEEEYDVDIEVEVINDDAERFFSH